MGKKKVVLDTNILISALGWEGQPRLIFNMAINNDFELIISDKQLEEIIKVLNYPKFSFNYDQKSRFINLLLEISTLIKLNKIINVIEDDPEDNIIITSAVIGNADFIITGDEHILKLKKFRTISILNARDFINLI